MAVRTLVVWVAVFWITVLETLIATWESRADRQSTNSRRNRFSLKSAFWAGGFELVLFIDIMMLVKEGWGIIVPIVLGAIISKYWSLERRRAKFRRHVRVRVRSKSTLEKLK